MLHADGHPEMCEGNENTKISAQITFENFPKYD